MFLSVLINVIFLKSFMMTTLPDAVTILFFSSTSMLSLENLISPLFDDKLLLSSANVSVSYTHLRAHET